MGKTSQFWTFKCTSLLQHSKPVQQNYLHYFKNFKNTLHAPRVKVSLICAWRFDREGDTTFFSFWNFYSFELTFLFIYCCFPNGSKPRRVSDYVVDCFWKSKESDGRETKRHYFGKTSHFQIFRTFVNLEIDFGINSKNVSDKLSILSKLRYFFVNILTHYKRDLKHAVTMPSRQEYCLTCIYGCIKFYCPKVRGSWFIRA